MPIYIPHSTKAQSHRSVSSTSCSSTSLGLNWTLHFWWSVLQATISTT